MMRNVGKQPLLNTIAPPDMTGWGGGGVWGRVVGGGESNDEEGG